MSENNAKSLLEKHWRIAKWFPDLGPEVNSTLRAYYLELLKFNPKINLISRKTEMDADQVHFADSVMAGKLLLKANAAKVIVDIGSGNGFPGLVIAALAPDRKVVLVDKDTRKIEFIKHVAAKMALKNFTTHVGLLENFPVDSIECGISRGFASLSGAIIAGRKSFKINGEYFHMKSSAWASEMAEIPTQLSSVWAPRLVGEYKLPESSTTMYLVGTKKLA